MRNYLVPKIIQLMHHDQEIIFLTADLGFGTFEIIQQQFPERFYNVGIAEQNMIGVACGLFLAGKKVIVYSIANFSTLRVIEQIRNYLLYHNCHVLIINGGAGFSYGQLGYTHHAIEDVSAIKALPQIKVFVPFDKTSIEESIEEWYTSNSTVYLRLEKVDVANIENLERKQSINVIGENKSNYIIGYGTIISEAIIAQKILQIEYNISVTIIILSEVKDLPDELYQSLQGASTVVFIEENSSQGGVGEHFFASAMIKGLNFKSAKIFAVKNFISETIGEQSYMRTLHKIDSLSIVNFFLNI